jgi:hypothetical protein
MKNILQIALAIVFVLSGAALSSAQTRPFVSRPIVIRVPSGRIWVIYPRLPLIPPVKQPTVFNSLPPWATKLSPAITSPFPTGSLTAPSKPLPFFGIPVTPKVKPFESRNKFLADQWKLEMARTVTKGIIDMALRNKSKDSNRLIPNRSTILPNSSSGNSMFDQPQNGFVNKNSAPVVIVTKSLDKPILPPAPLAPTLQPTSSGLVNNSTLKVVHITADGTAILTDGQNNYYSLPPNNTRINQGNVLQSAAKPSQQKRYARRNR